MNFQKGSERAKFQRALGGHNFEDCREKGTVYYFARAEKLTARRGKTVMETLELLTAAGCCPHNAKAIGCAYLQWVREGREVAGSIVLSFA